MRAIDYPGEIPSGLLSFSLTVDGAEIIAKENGDKLMLVKRLVHGDEIPNVSQFVSYAAGRMLKEDAVLSWDPDGNHLILWQEVPADVSENVLRRFFEIFTTSVDWWVARLKDSSSAVYIPEMMIRP